MSGKKANLITLQDWYSSLPVQKNGIPARGTIAAALVVLERLKAHCALDLVAHRAPGGSQISGASGAAVKRILGKFGEHRPFVTEGGRTNRGGPGDIAGMLDALRSAGFASLSATDRELAIENMQGFLVDKVKEYHNRERLKISFDPSRATTNIIRDLLAEAAKTGKEGPVAQYLVGAKLQLRFPGYEVSNESYSTSDDQTGRSGDFRIGDTVFHVTVAPGSSLYGKCERNLRDGLRVYILVPERSEVGARQNVQLFAPDRIAVESIESFVGNNIEELSFFSGDNLKDEFRSLLELYNHRVDATELDKSMLVDIPRNLARK